MQAEGSTRVVRYSSLPHTTLKVVDAARQERGRGLGELDVTKPLPEFINDGPYKVALEERPGSAQDMLELLVNSVN